MLYKALYKEPTLDLQPIMASMMYLTKNTYTTNPILLVKWFVNNLHLMLTAFQASLIIEYEHPDLGHRGVDER
jgi:hypothetical protein